MTDTALCYSCRVKINRREHTLHADRHQAYQRPPHGNVPRRSGACDTSPDHALGQAPRHAHRPGLYGHPGVSVGGTDLTAINQKLHAMGRYAIVSAFGGAKPVEPGSGQPAALSEPRARQPVRDLICGFHHGERSDVPHQQAVHRYQTTLRPGNHQSCDWIGRTPTAVAPMRSTARQSTGLHTAIPLSGQTPSASAAPRTRHRPAAKGCMTSRMHH